MPFFSGVASIAILATSLPIADAYNSSSSIWVDQIPTYVRPYAIRGCVVGQQIYRFLVTGPSSDSAFTLISTNAPGSTSLGVLPHIHQTHYETFFNYRGRFQLWTEKYDDEETRVLIPGDYGAVPYNTTHTFQILDPDTEMVGDLFYALASRNYSSITSSPYDPSITSDSSLAGSDSSVISILQVFDVYAQLDYSPRRDAINGTAPSNTTWHTGDNTLAAYSNTPYFVTKDYGPKYLSTIAGYQIIQPLVTPTQSAGNFTLSTITMDRLLKNVTIQDQNFPGHAAFEVLEGQLQVLLDGELYYSTVAFTKILHIGQGYANLDTTLIANSTS
ncbi:hypothetical protein G7Y89_g5040 [Cudoniella acicularis]|uniref:RmlC-like cupin n=1 Tax=Cudoniella acicularis TaxID=354080 RepID=A0A8H4RQG5_9HELO|nr:hypothetical protein G7Y89_g5040 [Cudoniella acicularis]